MIGLVYSNFSAEACAILQASCWSRQHQPGCHFSSLLALSLLCFPLFYPYISCSLAYLAGTILSLPSGCNGSPVTHFFLAMTLPMNLPGGLRCFNHLFVVVSYFSYRLFSFLELEAYTLIEIPLHTNASNIHGGTCASSSRSLCSLVSSLQRTQPSVNLSSLELAG